MLSGILGWILGVLGLGGWNAAKQSQEDDFGGNGTDREYVDYLRSQVDAGKMTEEEAIAKMESKWNNPNKSARDYWNSYKKTASGGYSVGNVGSTTGMTDVLSSLVAYFTRNQLTGAELEQNEFNAGEAQKSRDFTEFMARNKYSMETQSMTDAGVNPAMVYGGGNLVPTAANGATGSGSVLSGGNIADLISTLVRMPVELKQMNAQIDREKAEAQKARDEAWAAKYNAETGRMNAGSQARQAAVAERNAYVNEAQLEINKKLSESNIQVNDETIRKIAEETFYVKAQREQLPELLEISKKNANTAEKQAIAAMRQADAAVQNAATNDYMSTYQSDYLYAQRLGQEVINGQNQELLKVMPEKLQAEVEEFKARGFYFNEQGKLANKNQSLVTAQTVRQYELMVTDVANAAVNVAGAIATGGLSGAMKGSTSVTYDPAPANGSYGTYGDYGPTATYFYE